MNGCKLLQICTAHSLALIQSIWPLSERPALLPLPHATCCNQHQSQENSLLFWTCKCILHLPINPLDLIIKGLYFSYDVFQSSEYYFLVAVVPVCWRCYDPHVGKFLSFLKSGLKLMTRQPYLLSTISMFNTEHHTLGNLCSFWSQIP